MDERAFRATAREPLRERLRRRAAASERRQSAACEPRVGARAGVRDQRPQARRADCRELCDPARGLFRFARRTWQRSADRPCRAARRAAMLNLNWERIAARYRLAIGEGAA